jgi:hypothetical protein
MESTRYWYDQHAGKAHARSALRRQMSMSHYAQEIERYINARGASASNAQALGESLIRRGILSREDLKLLDAKMLRTTVETEPPQLKVTQLSEHRKAEREVQASSEDRSRGIGA